MTRDTKPPIMPKLRFPQFRHGSGWNQSKLGKESFILKGKGISKSDIHPDGSQPCIRYGELYTHYNEVISIVISKTKLPIDELFLSKANDVIIPSSGETKIDIATASCILADGIALGGDLNVIRSTLNGSFLSYYLNGPKRFDIAKVAQGDTVVHLYPNQLEELEIAVPSPAEQQKIAECLSTLDERIGAESQKLDALKAHKKGLMQQLFPREGILLPSLRFPEFKNTGEWNRRQLDDVLESISNGLSIDQNGSSEGFRVTRIETIADRTIDISKVGYITTRQDISDHKLQIGDILFSNINSISHIGKTVFISQEYDLYHGMNLLRLIVSQKENDPLFVYYLLNTEEICESFRARANKAVNQASINQTELGKTAVILPKKTEQRRIAAFLSSLDNLIAAQSDKLETLKTHKKGLMQQLFPFPSEDSK